MKTILIVEDELDLLDMMKDLLEDAGYAVLTASDGRAALEQMDLSAVDLVITDVMMPIMSGGELLEAMHERPRLAGTRAIVMSAAHGAELARRFQQRFLRKPFDVATLLEEVRDLIGPAAR